MSTQKPANIRYKRAGLTGHYRVIVDGQDIGEVYKYQTYPARYPSWVSWKYRGAGRQGWPTREQAAQALAASIDRDQP